MASIVECHLNLPAPVAKRDDDGRFRVTLGDVVLFMARAEFELLVDSGRDLLDEDPATGEIPAVRSIPDDPIRGIDQRCLVI